MKTRCHKEALFVARIRDALGVDVRPVQCHVVDGDGMTEVMRGSGWGRNDAAGVVGFQVGRHVYVRNDAAWTTLHELVHRAGINADRLNRFVAEGLVEVLAATLSRSPDEHRPTYPEETRWVRAVLLPKTGLDALSLGRKLARAPDAPAALADLLAARNPSLDRARLVRELQPQVPERPSLGSRSVVIRRGPDPARAPQLAPADDVGTAVVLGVLVAGVALALPSVLRQG